jgi:Putative peptidoglycan binding domain
MEALLQEGDQGKKVEALQRRLKALGFDPGQIDGVFGPRTVSALINFQERKGLRPNGIVFQPTALALGLNIVSKRLLVDAVLSFFWGSCGGTLLVEYVADSGAQISPQVASLFVILCGVLYGLSQVTPERRVRSDWNYIFFGALLGGTNVLVLSSRATFGGVQASLAVLLPVVAFLMKDWSKSGFDKTSGAG